MADLNWREIRADFSGVNQALAGASHSMSQAGNIFSRMREQRLAEQKAAQDELYRQQALEEQIRQFGVASDLEQEKLREQQRQFGVTSGLAERQFGEGVRQFDIEERGRQLGRQIQAGQITQELPSNVLANLGITPTQTTTRTPSGPSFDLNALTQDVSNRYGIDPRVMANLFNAESSGNPNAVSSAGAQGLGQLMPGTAKEMGVTNPFDPIQNAEGSAKYLSRMLDRYNNLEDALAAFNWGPGNVDKYIAGGRTGNMPQETKDFISKVTAGINPQEVTSNYSVARQDAVRQQGDRASILGERASLVSPMSPTTRTAISPTTIGTPNSPLLGISNPYQDRIDAIESGGGMAGSDLVKQAQVKQKEINEKEDKEEKRLFSNELVFRSMVDSGGNPEDARARYESDWIAKYGEKPTTNPLDRAVELQVRDRELLEKAKANDEASRKQLYSALASNYEDFISKRVDPEHKFPYENNITKAVQNSRLFGDDPAKEPARRGAISRAIVQKEMGDTVGLFFNSRFDKLGTANFRIDDEAANALLGIANFDPSTQTLEDMTPAMKAIYDVNVDYGLIPEDIQKQLSAGTRAAKSRREEDKDRIKALRNNPTPSTNTQARYSELTRRLDIPSNERKENLTGLEARISKDIRSQVPLNREERTMELLSKEFRRIADPRGRSHYGETPLREIPQEYVPLFTVDTNNRFKIFEDKVNQYYSGNRTRTDAAMIALRELRREVNQGS